MLAPVSRIGMPVRIFEVDGAVDANTEDVVAPDVLGTAQYARVLHERGGEGRHLIRRPAPIAGGAVERPGGGLAVIDALQSLADTPQTSTRSDYQQTRLRPEPPEILSALRSDVGQSVLAACGVPGRAGRVQAWKWL